MCLSTRMLHTILVRPSSLGTICCVRAADVIPCHEKYRKHTNFRWPCVPRWHEELSMSGIFQEQDSLRCYDQADRSNPSPLNSCLPRTTHSSATQSLSAWMIDCSQCKHSPSRHVKGYRCGARGYSPCTQKTRCKSHIERLRPQSQFRHRWTMVHGWRAMLCRPRILDEGYGRRILLVTIICQGNLAVMETMHTLDHPERNSDKDATGNH